MKCYICLTEPNSQNDVYNDLLEATVVSARQNTSLEVIALYDGSHSHRCYKIMIDNDVTVIDHSFSHKKYLDNTYPKEYLLSAHGRMIPYDKISGTFMRFDVPFIEKEEDFVIYVDIDVIFLKDITLHDIPKPKYIAAAPEFCKDVSKITYFNAGIMVINVKNMRERCAKVFSDLKAGKRNTTGLFDQGYLNQYCFDDMELLPLEFNWKPYWGINKNASIIHYHGMKPGGNNNNSGFGMNDEVLANTLVGQVENIEGYIYYMLLYFDYIKKDGKEWISKFTGHTAKILESVINPETGKTCINYEKKIKKIKKKYKTLIIIILCAWIITFWGYMLCLV